MHRCAAHKPQAGIILATLLILLCISYYQPPSSGSCIQHAPGQLMLCRFCQLTHSISVYTGDKPGIVEAQGQNDNIHVSPSIRSLAVSLTEINEHLAVALPHVLRHSKDTGHIVVEE